MMHVVEVDVLVAHIIVGDDIDAHARNQVGHLVLDERVAMIGTAHEHDDETMVVARFTKHILAEVGQPLLEHVLRINGLVDGLIDRLATLHAKALQQFAALLAQQLLILERDGRGNEFGHGALHRLDHLTVPADDGTVETVLATIGTLVDDKGQEDPLHAALHEVADMAVHQLGGETDVVAHHHACVTLVLAIVGGRRKDNVDTGVGEEGVPERVFLKLVQGSGNAEGGVRGV